MYTQADIVDTVSQFNQKTLPKEKWTHQAHIMVAFWYANEYDFEEGLALLREAIKGYNLSVGTQNTDTGGYHETLTVFWLTLVKAYIREKKPTNLEEGVNQFLNRIVAGTGFPLIFYSGEILFSKEARYEWIPPNKLPMEDAVLFMDKSIV